MVVALAVALSPPVGVDRAVREQVASLPGWVVALAGPGSQLGSGALLYPSLLVLVAVLRTWRAAAALGALAVGQVLEAVLLSASSRSPVGLEPWGGLSSGRTATAVLGWGLVVLLVRSSARAAAAAGVVAGSVVAVSRVVADVHWTSDAVVGLLVGLALLLTAGGLERAVPRTRIAAGPLLAWTRGSPWAWGLVAAAALVAVVPPLLEPEASRFGDLAVYVGSAGVVGEGGDLYRFRTEAGLPFTYPPFAALLAEPLARVPLPLVQLLWVLATLAATVAVAAVAMSPVVARLGLPVTTALLLVSTPVRSHLRFGQVGLFLVLLVSLDLLRRGHRGGWGVGLATAVKLTPGTYLLWLLAVGRWARARASLAWAAGATLLGMLLVWPSSPTWVTSALWDSSRFGRNDIPGNQSVRGMLLRATSDDATAERLWLVAAVVLLVVGVAGARRLELDGDRLGAVGVLAATSVAVSPISWQHHLVWLVLPIAALVAAGREWLAAAWALLLVAPVTSLALQVDVPVLGALLVNTCGLTAVAAAVLLPHLVGRAGVASRLPAAAVGGGPLAH